MKKFSIQKVLLLSTIVFAMLMAGCSQKEIDAKFVKIVEKANQQMPLNLPNNLRCDSMAITGAKNLTYYYTTLGFQKSEIPDLNNTLKAMKVIICKSLSTSSDPDVAYLRQLGVALTYRYTDKSGELLGDITIKPDEY